MAMIRYSEFMSFHSNSQTISKETKMTYLITGATGNIGSRVVARLLERGERPRVLARDGAKAQARFGDRVDVVVGDLADAASLPAAFSGADALLLINSGPELARRDEAAAAVAQAAGIGHVVKLSALGARATSATAQLGSWHAAGEAAIRKSGVRWTFVQPAGFMTNALAWAPAIKADGVVRASTGDGQVAMIHPEDIAAVATRALTTREYDGQSLPITGPALLSYAEMTGAIGAAVGKTLAFQAISDEQARQCLLASGTPMAVAEALVGLWRAVRQGQVAIVTDGVERVVGRKPIAFAQWAEENAACF
jgi:uncharacterized protein YbjT (DUF2867 family)